jgi:hypothetical protein
VRALTCELPHIQCLIPCYIWAVNYYEGEDIGLVAAAPSILLSCLVNVGQRHAVGLPQEAIYFC